MGNRIVLPAILSGRSSRHRVIVVHAVECDEQEKRSGIRYLAHALCGKGHGPRSAGWGHLPDETAITCAKCAKLMEERQ